MRLSTRRAFIEALEPRTMLAVNVTVNASQRFQEMDGFGTALAWWMNAPYQSPAFKDLYYQDLGSSMLRVDININSLAGADNDIATPVVLGSNLQTNISLFDFSAQGVANFGHMANASLTKRIDSFKLIGSLWTPPHWMKGTEVNPVTGTFTTAQPAIIDGNSCGGSLIDTPGNLEQFGRYVAAYVKGFEQRYGVPFYAISIQNELAFRQSYNSCVYSPQLYVKALKAVSNAFDLYGITTRIQGPEDVGVGDVADPAILKRQFNYINAVRADPEAMADLDIYSIHGYANDGVTSNRSPEMWRQYWLGRPAGQYPAPNWTGISGDGKKSWMTETSGGNSHNWTNAFRIAANLQDAITQSNVSAWLYWQTVDETPPPNPATLTHGTDTTDPKYNAAKHFFRYIRPGAFRVDASPSNPTGVYASAFVHDHQRTMTVVLINDGSSQETVNLSLPGSNVNFFNIARRSSAAETWMNIGPVNVVSGVASVTMPADSVITLQGPIDTGIDPPRPVATAGGFVYDTEQLATVTFDQNVSASLSPNDLLVENLTTPFATVTVGNIGFNVGTNVATFALSTIIPDGNYRATVLANGVTNAFGDVLLQNFSFDFFFLNGDATRNRSVGGEDFSILATNFGTAGKTFSQGNFSYDDLGNVDSADFNILASQFGKTLAGGEDQSRGASLPAGGSSASGSLFAGSSRTDEDDDEV